MFFTLLLYTKLDISGLNISPCLRYWSQCRHDHYTWTNDFKRLLLILSPLESEVTGPELICLGPVGWVPGQPRTTCYYNRRIETNNNTLTRHERGQELRAQRKKSERSDQPTQAYTIKLDQYTLLIFEFNFVQLEVWDQNNLQIRIKFSIW
mgnify:CR=1 FL=1